jgi:hypothetical protein
MSNIANYFCEKCGTLLHRDLCRRCDKEELEILEGKDIKEKPKTKKTPPKKTKPQPRKAEVKPIESVKENGFNEIKPEEPKIEEKPIIINEDPYMILINANRLNIRPSTDVLNKLKNFHFRPGDDNMLKEVGDKAVKMEHKYLHLVKAGFLITIFKTCNGDKCKFAVPELEITCPGHKFVRLTKWLIEDYI